MLFELYSRRVNNSPIFFKILRHNLYFLFYVFRCDFNKYTMRVLLKTAKEQYAKNPALKEKSEETASDDEMDDDDNMVLIKSKTENNEFNDDDDSSEEEDDSDQDNQFYDPLFDFSIKLEYLEHFVKNMKDFTTINKTI